MALIIPVGFAEAVLPIRNTASSHVATVTFGVDVSGVGGDYVTAADAITAEWDSDIASEMDFNTVTGPCVLSVGQDGGPPLAVSGSTTSAGGSVHTSPPPQVALIIKKLSGTGGRRGRGRFFVPWLLATADVNEGGFIDPSRVTTFTTAFGVFLAGLAASGPPMVLLHSDGISAAGDPSPITALVADNLVGTQRRRLGR